MNSERIASVVGPVLEQFGLDLDAVEVKPAGRRSVVRVVVDGDGPDGTGPSLDDIAEATKAVSAALDGSDATGAGPYTLEVTSRGVSRPLTLPRHWRRNHDRLVKASLSDGEVVTGRIAGSDEDSATLDIAGSSRQIAYSEIAAAMIQVELNRPNRKSSTGKEN
jgi:ribosome maturation factor RimP